MGTTLPSLPADVGCWMALLLVARAILEHGRHQVVGFNSKDSEGESSQGTRQALFPSHSSGLHQVRDVPKSRGEGFEFQCL